MSTSVSAGRCAVIGEATRMCRTIDLLTATASPPLGTATVGQRPSPGVIADQAAVAVENARLFTERKAPTYGPQRCLRSRCQLQFGHDVADVGNRGSLADEQAVGSLSVRQTLGDELQDLPFALGEPSPPGAGRPKRGGVAYNLARWTANAAALGRITTKTLRTTIISAPARLVTSSRRLRLRLPTRWTWADHITTALTTIRAIDPAPG